MTFMEQFVHVEVLLVQRFIIFFWKINFLRVSNFHLNHYIFGWCLIDISQMNSDQLVPVCSVNGLHYKNELEN